MKCSRGNFYFFVFLSSGSHLYRCFLLGLYVAWWTGWKPLARIQKLKYLWWWRIGCRNRYPTKIVGSEWMKVEKLFLITFLHYAITLLWMKCCYVDNSFLCRFLNSSADPAVYLPLSHCNCKQPSDWCSKQLYSRRKTNLYFHYILAVWTGWYSSLSDGRLMVFISFRWIIKEQLRCQKILFSPDWSFNDSKRWQGPYAINLWVLYDSNVHLRGILKGQLNAPTLIPFFLFLFF